MVVTDPADYERVIQTLKDDSPGSRDLRQDLAVKAFEHTAQYDGMIADYFGRRTGEHTHASPAAFPRTLNVQMHRVDTLRYGENPHQQGAFYAQPDPAPGTIAGATLRQGKPLSFNNVMDADAALACVSQFCDRHACVVVKHANPCGVAVAGTQLEAYNLAYATDPTSAFGGIIAFNQPLEKGTIEAILDRQFVEVIVAPGLGEQVIELLAAKPNIRVLDCHA